MILNKKNHTTYLYKLKQSNHTLKFGRFGLKTLSFVRITDKQLQSLERSFWQITKKHVNNKKTMKLWNLIILNLQLTKLSSESRMGKGKGSVYQEAAFLKPGTILFEFDGISNQQMSKVFSFIKSKVSFKISLIKKLY